MGSRIGLTISVTGSVALVSADVALLFSDPDRLADPWQALSLIGLGLLGLASLIVQASVRIRGAQEIIAEQLILLLSMPPEPEDDEPEPREPAGLTPQSLAIARRLSERLNHAA